MAENLFVQVALDNSAQSFDRLYTYRVDGKDNILPGMRVSIPFGNGNRTRIGMVISVTDTLDEDIPELKTVLSVLDENPVINKELIELALWMREKYFCTYGDAIHCMIPPGMLYKVSYNYSLGSEIPESDKTSEFQNEFLSTLRVRNISSNDLRKSFNVSDDYSELLDLLKKGVIKREELFLRKTGDASQKMISSAENFEGILTLRQREIYEILCEFGSLSVKELSYFTGASKGVFDALVKKGAADYFDVETYRRPKTEAKRAEASTSKLSDEQNKVFEQLKTLVLRENFDTALLYGVTGSGKTQVYINLIDCVLKRGQEVIVLVPEISLTSQTVQSLKNRFGDDSIAIIHSGLSNGERYDEWKRCRDGLVKIAVGTRSAVFAPFSNLGLIVIDEEHEHTYKSEMSPRYDAKEVAAHRCRYANALLLLTSATPAISSVVKSETGSIHLFSLKNRFGNAVLPQVEIIDMINETLNGNTSELAETTKKSLIDNYKNKKQSIVLINRRGYHTYVRCTKCRTVVTCPNCSISLTYHFDNNRLMCHYCGYSTLFTPVCGNCGSESVSARGIGTQKAEMILQDLLPDARILRVDTDSVSRKFSLDKKLDEFSDGNYDIMVGTQMVSKGLNFENVTLVCVLNIDQLLYNVDYESNERTYQLLTQVVGRAGRGRYPGKAIIQTEMPQNIYIKLASEQKFGRFYKIEKSYRKMLLYPPFCDLLMCMFISDNDETVRLSAENFLSIMTENAKLEEFKNLPLRIYQPTEANIFKIGNKFRYKMMVKCRNSIKLRAFIRFTVDQFYLKNSRKKVSVIIDINPESMC